MAWIVAGLVGVGVSASGVLPAEGQDAALPSTLDHVTDCGPGSAPETDIQGRVSLADHESGRADEPYTCNTELVGTIASGGGFKVWRVVDDLGNECAYYDSTLVFPFDAIDPRRDSGGVFVVDMSDPANPTLATELLTPAMVSPHESLVYNKTRGLLAAVVGTPATFPGIVDIYDVHTNCLEPTLLSSSPVGFLGHESGFSPDGNTLYTSSLFNGSIAAIDVSDPALPTIITIVLESSHGVTLSEDGTRAYLASLTGATDQFGAGLKIIDTTAIQNRELLATTPEVSRLTWPEVSIPQAIFPVGAARIISIEDETAPRVVSNIRLEVHEPDARAGDSANDPGATFLGRGYAGHYCSVPTTVDPTILACSMIVSGLRVFDISDPTDPREIAYYNHPGTPIFIDPFDQQYGAAYAMSAPAFAPERNEIWYSDVASGFHVVRLTNGLWNDAGVPPATPATPDPVVSPAPASPPSPTPAASAAPAEAASAAPQSATAPALLPLPTTGPRLALGLLGLASILGGMAMRRRR